MSDTIRISCKIINETGQKLTLAGWPTKLASGDYGLGSSSSPKMSWDNTVQPPGSVISDSQVIIASMRKVHLTDHFGWVYIDLLRPDETHLHLQLFLHLARSGIQAASLGHVDLTSSVRDPMPSGELGKVTFIDANAQEVVYYLTSDLATAKNIGHDAIVTKSRGLLGKKFELSSFVSAEFTLVSFLVGDEAREHEYVPLTEGQRIAPILTTKHKIEGGSKHCVEVWGLHKETQFFNGFVKFNALEKAVSHSAFSNTSESTTIFANDMSWTFCYGFSDSAREHSQVYAYLTPNRSNWIGDLIKGNPQWLQTPFSKLCLPGAHDSGMYIRLDPGLATFIASGKLGDVFGHEAIMAIANPAAHILIKVLETFKYSPDSQLDNLANTQKDPFPNQLLMGVRFFDVRPGYCFYDVINLKKGELHHQHSFVPGAAYLDFLTNVLDFLDAHPHEFVFAEIKKSGFLLSHDVIHEGKLVAYSMVPSVEELAVVLEQARSAVANRATKRIEIGTEKDLDRPMGQLIEENRRFFMLDKMHEPDAWPKADSYDGKAYGTQDPKSIIAQLEKTYDDSMSQPDVQPGLEDSVTGKPRRGAIYQLQATPQVNIKEDILTGLKASDAGSLLVYMKPRMDRVTYPWVDSKAFKEPGNVILLNDFVEGLLVEHAIMKSRDRAGF